MAEGKLSQLPARDDIEGSWKWKLEDIYPADEDWQRDFQKVSGLVEEVAQFRGKLASSAAQLLKGLKADERLGQLLERLAVYAHMRSDEDQTVSKYQAMNEQIIAVAVQAQSATAFMVPEILTLDEEKLAAYEQQEPELRKYDYYLREILRKKPHTRSTAEEEIIAATGELAQVPGHIFSMLNNADLKFPTIKDEDGQEVELTKGRYSTFMESTDRRVRRDAFTALYEAYGNLKNTLAASLNGAVKQEVFYARIRKYPSALEAALDQDHIPVSVYTSLIKTVRDHFDVMYRYMDLRKKMLKLDELHMYDLYVPMVPEVQMKVSYQEALEMVVQGLAPLGKEYQDKLQEAFQARWIDVYENRGKRSGAYSTSAYGVHPYVLLNYQDTIDHVFTIAHEMGHAMHSYFSEKTQPYIYAHYTIFVAEVASTLNEALLLNYLLKNVGNTKQKMFLINHYLEQFRTTVYRQVMFAEFEKMMHEKVEAGEALTAECLSNMYLKLNQDYYGPGVYVDDEIALEWSRIPHFYSNFYVYKYATGFSAAQALSRRILHEGEPAVGQYLAFLKGGGADTPINLLKRAGVDMTSPEPVRQALQIFRENLEHMEQLAEK